MVALELAKKISARARAIPAGAGVSTRLSRPSGWPTDDLDLNRLRRRPDAGKSAGSERPRAVFPQRRIACWKWPNLYRTRMGSGHGLCHGTALDLARVSITRTLTSHIKAVIGGPPCSLVPLQRTPALSATRRCWATCVVARGLACALDHLQAPRDGLSGAIRCSQVTHKMAFCC